MTLFIKKSITQEVFCYCSIHKKGGAQTSPRHFLQHVTIPKEDYIFGCGLVTKIVFSKPIYVVAPCKTIESHLSRIVVGGVLYVAEHGVGHQTAVVVETHVGNFAIG
jgi:hypothetical protein